jgi:peptidoglycan hydrolase FlgJ
MKTGDVAAANLTRVPAGVKPRTPDDPQKVRDAAQQFEALLLTQILRSARESQGGWFGDSSSDSATDFAEQHLAETLAQRGGLGLADLVAKGLHRDE